MKRFVLISCLLFTALNFFSNAQTWKSYGTGLSYSVNSIVYFNDKLYAAGGSVYSWNGNTWDENSAGMVLLMNVHTLAVYNNTLFSGGFFTVLTPDGNWYNNAARYYNGSWTTCGSGMGNDGWGPDEYVNAMIVYNGELYAGGAFGSAGGTPLNPQETGYMARFDGSLWHPVGTGMNFSVTDLCIYDGELIASGYFTEAGGVPANYIAKWNGSSWSALSTGMDSKVTALAEYNGELYAGGWFSTAGGSPALSMAKWNGQSWSPVGNGILGGQVYTLAVYNNELYAGGTFNSIAGNAGDYIMKWDGSQWKSVGSGTDGDVIYIYPHGSELIIGGSFYTAGGIFANKIAAFSSITDVSEDKNLPNEFLLNQNYPNPFNPSTKIRYSLKEDGFTTLKIFNLLGQEIAILVNGEKPAGIYEVSFNGLDLPSGTYIYKIQSGSFIYTRKMVLIK